MRILISLYTYPTYLGISVDVGVYMSVDMGVDAGVDVGVNTV